MHYNCKLWICERNINDIPQAAGNCVYIHVHHKYMWGHNQLQCNFQNGQIEMIQRNKQKWKSKNVCSVEIVDFPRSDHQSYD